MDERDKTLNGSQRQTLQQALLAWFGILPEAAVITPPMMATWWQREVQDAAEHLERFREEGLLLTASPMEIEEQTYPCYRLSDRSHDMARRLLEASPPEGLGLSQAKAHQLLMERYLVQGVNAQVHEPDWTALPDDGYIYDHLFWHMENAGQWEQMVSLLQKETSRGKNAWYRARHFSLSKSL